MLMKRDLGGSRQPCYLGRVHGAAGRSIGYRILRGNGGRGSLSDRGMVFMHLLKTTFLVKFSLKTLFSTDDENP